MYWIECSWKAIYIYSLTSVQSRGVWPFVFSVSTETHVHWILLITHAWSVGMVYLLQLHSIRTCDRINIDHGRKRLIKEFMHTYNDFLKNLMNWRKVKTSSLKREFLVNLFSFLYSNITFTILLASKVLKFKRFHCYCLCDNGMVQWMSWNFWRNCAFSHMQVFIADHKSNKKKRLPWILLNDRCLLSYLSKLSIDYVSVHMWNIA